MLPHFYESIQGWFDFPDLYREMIKWATDKSLFMEIGTGRGKSAAYMAVEIANSGKNIVFGVVDNWEGNIKEEDQREEAKKKDMKKEFLNNMEKGRVLHKYVQPFHRTSLEAAALFPDNILDFVFLDSGHDYDSVKQDILAWLPKIKATGFLGGYGYDPVYEAGLVKAVDELLPSRVVGWGRCWLYGKDADKIPRGDYKPWGLIRKPEVP